MIETSVFFFIVHLFAQGISGRKGIWKSLTVSYICRFNLTPKIGPLHLIQNHLQSSRTIIFQYSEHPKIKFYTFFTYTNQKKLTTISFSMFSTRSKMKNRVKIIDFLTLLRITRKVIITEQ
jgi:hypothetical protein